MRGAAIAETVPSGTFTMSSRLSEVIEVITNSVAADADSGYVPASTGTSLAQDMCDVAGEEDGVPDRVRAQMGEEFTAVVGVAVPLVGVDADAVLRQVQTAWRAA